MIAAFKCRLTIGAYLRLYIKNRRKKSPVKERLILLKVRLKSDIFPFIYLFEHLFIRHQITFCSIFPVFHTSRGMQKSFIFITEVII